MKKTTRNFLALFFITLFFQTLLGRAFPFFYLNAFPAYLCFLVTRLSLLKVSYVALLVGTCLDLQTSSLHFGIHAAIYTLTTMLLFKFRHNFFIDKPFGIFLLATTFSAVSTLLLSFFQVGLHFSLVTAIVDFGIMPLFDGSLGMLFYYFPEKSFSFLKRKHFFVPFFRRILKTEKYE